MFLRLTKSNRVACEAFTFTQGYELAFQPSISVNQIITNLLFHNWRSSDKFQCFSFTNNDLENFFCFEINIFFTSRHTHAHTHTIIFIDKIVRNPILIECTLLPKCLLANRIAYDVFM